MEDIPRNQGDAESIRDTTRTRQHHKNLSQTKVFTADNLSFANQESKDDFLSADSFAMLSNLVVPNSPLEIKLIGLTNWTVAKPKAKKSKKRTIKKDHYHRQGMDNFNDLEAKESRTPLNGQTTAKEIESEIKLGNDIKNGIPP